MTPTHKLSTVVGSVVLMLSLTGCGREAGPAHSSKNAATDESTSALLAPAGSESRQGMAEPELDYVPDDTVARCEPPPHGMLTAGSLNDVKETAAFRNYIRSVQNGRASGLPDLISQWSGRRIEIIVRNSSGQPVPDARVQVYREESADDIQLKYQESDSGHALVTSLKTGTDGRTQFLPGLDGSSSDDTWKVLVADSEGHVRSEQSGLTGQQSTWDFAIGQARADMPRQLDLALVIDTTGSMGDELEYLKLEISNIVSRIEQLFPGINQQFALVLYRDDGDRYVTRSFDFTDSLNEFQRSLSDQHAGGGGDYPEAVHAALERATELSWQDRESARVLFLVGDAPPHQRHLDRTFDAVQNLRERDVALFPVSGSGTRDEAEMVFRTAAFLTRGQYLFLTDHSGIGLPHSTPHAPQFNVEWLSAVMLRMIASELSGREVLPSEIIATEETTTPMLAQMPVLQPVASPPVRYARRSFFSEWEWSDVRPLVALALLLLLAIGERCLSRRRAVRQN